MKFQKGQSGNPKGRPKGAVGSLRSEMRKKLEERGHELLEAAIAQALAGDSAILKFLLERLLPSVGEHESAAPPADPRFSDD